MKKGFTLIELLAVIVILAIILIIAIPQILSVIAESRINSFNASSTILEKATSTYLSANDITIEEGTTTEILYSDIKDAGFISEVVDPMDKSECTNSRVYVTNTGGVYTYESALVCENYMDIDYYNLVTNGDFSSGTTGWSVVYSSNSVVDNILLNTGSGYNMGPILDNINFSTVDISHKYYARYIARVTNSSCTNLWVAFDGTTAGADNVIVSQTSPVANTWYSLSAVDTPSADATGLLRIYIRHYYVDATTANGKVMQVDGTRGVYAFDLTSIYGAGNEPTATQMDNIMDNMGK
jgi:prepilin-type N-terminal cleavage/methylation domain-containing protein